MQTREAYAAARIIAAAGGADGGDAALVARRLEDVLGLSPAAAAVEARRCLLHQRDRRVHETLVLAAQPELLAELVAEIPVDGEDALRPARLLVSFHYGPYSSLLWLRLARALGGDPPLAILVDRGLDPNLVLPTSRVRALEAAGVLPARSFVAVEGPLAARNLARHLEAGGAALVFADAWIAQRGVVAELGRRTLVLPRGVAWLAARTASQIAGALVRPVDDGHRVSVTAAPDVDAALAGLLRSVEADPAPWEGWLRASIPITRWSPRAFYRWRGKPARGPREQACQGGSLVDKKKRVSMDEVEAEDAVSLPNKEVMSLLDVNANVDLGLDLAAPVDLAAAANLNVAAPIEASASANVLSPDAQAVSEAYQHGSIDQSISGSANATAPQHAAISQDTTGTGGAATGGATPAETGGQPATSGVGSAVDGATSGATGAVDGASGATGAVDGATGAVDGATGGATSGVTSGVGDAVGGVTSGAGDAVGGATGGVESLLSGGNLLDANVNIHAAADLTAPTDGAVAANANVAAPIDAAVAANIGSPGAGAEALAPQEVDISQNLDHVSADATATQDASVEQK